MFNRWGDSAEVSLGTDIRMNRIGMDHHLNRDSFCAAFFYRLGHESGVNTVLRAQRRSFQIAARAALSKRGHIGIASGNAWTGMGNTLYN
jgi:hypothetical protein